MRKKSNKYNVHGESLTPRQILQQVSEEGCIELEKDLYLQTKENLTFEIEETIKSMVDEVRNDPEDEEYQENLINYRKEDYSASLYWITDKENKLLKEIKNADELEKYIIMKKLFKKS